MLCHAVDRRHDPGAMLAADAVHVHGLIGRVVDDAEKRFELLGRGHDARRHRHRHVVHAGRFHQAGFLRLRVEAREVDDSLHAHRRQVGVVTPLWLRAAVVGGADASEIVDLDGGCGDGGRLGDGSDLLPGDRLGCAERCQRKRQQCDGRGSGEASRYSHGSSVLHQTLQLTPQSAGPITHESYRHGVPVSYNVHPRRFRTRSREGRG